MSLTAVAPGPIVGYQSLDSQLTPQEPDYLYEEAVGVLGQISILEDNIFVPGERNKEKAEIAEGLLRQALDQRIEDPGLLANVAIARIKALIFLDENILADGIFQWAFGQTEEKTLTAELLILRAIIKSRRGDALSAHTDLNTAFYRKPTQEESRLIKIGVSLTHKELYGRRSANSGVRFDLGEGSPKIPGVDSQATPEYLPPTEPTTLA